MAISYSEYSRSSSGRLVLASAFWLTFCIISAGITIHQQRMMLG
jgi:hypothetical protein